MHAAAPTPAPVRDAARTSARLVAEAALARLERAWNDGDGAAFGALYAPDASFVTIRGLYVVGAEAIAAGHAEIFATIYAGSTNRMDLLRADEVADGVVRAVSRSTLDCPAGPLAGRHRAMSTSLIARAPGRGAWQVVATHNTLVVD